MKMLWMSLLVLVSCSDLRKPEDKGYNARFSSKVEYLGQPEKCLEFGNQKYCKWAKEIRLFEDDNEKAIFGISKSQLAYHLRVTGNNLSTLKDKKVYLYDAVDMKDWKRFEPLFAASLLKEGIETVSSVDESDLVLTVQYGVKGKKTKGDMGKKSEVEFSRFLTLRGYPTAAYLKKKASPVWGLEVTSVGSSSAEENYLPPQILAASNYYTTDGEIEVKREIKDQDFNLLVLKHYTGMK